MSFSITAKDPAGPTSAAAPYVPRSGDERGDGEREESVSQDAVVVFAVPASACSDGDGEQGAEGERAPLDEARRRDEPPYSGASEDRASVPGHERDGDDRPQDDRHGEVVVVAGGECVGGGPQHGGAEGGRCCGRGATEQPDRPSQERCEGHEPDQPCPQDALGVVTEHGPGGERQEM